MKRKLVVTFLLLFAVWPALQHTLVRHYDVDPWRLAGWGMYAAPGAMKTVRVVALSNEAPPRILDTRSYAEPDRAIIDLFRARRQALGDLASAESVATDLLKLHPEWEGVAIPVLSLRLDPQSARTRLSIASHTLWRSGEGPAYAATPETFATP